MSRDNGKGLVLSSNPTILANEERNIGQVMQSIRVDGSQNILEVRQNQSMQVINTLKDLRKQVETYRKQNLPCPYGE